MNTKGSFNYLQYCLRSVAHKYQLNHYIIKI